MAEKGDGQSSSRSEGDIGSLMWNMSSVVACITCTHIALLKNWPHLASKEVEKHVLYLGGHYSTDSSVSLWRWGGALWVNAYKI